MILFIWKKKVLIMFLAWGVSASSARPRLSIRIAVSKSTVSACTATSKIFSGAGSSPRVFLRIMGAPMVTICATCGFRILPPGILYPLVSQGCVRAASSSLLSKTHCLAAGTRSSLLSTTESISPEPKAFSGATRLPSTMYSLAAMSPMRYTAFTLPPPPGSKPNVTSGKPSWTLR